jgi:hypothetical protein
LNSFRGANMVTILAAKEGIGRSIGKVSKKISFSVLRRKTVGCEIQDFDINLSRMVGSPGWASRQTKIRSL